MPLVKTIDTTVKVPNGFRIIKTKVHVNAAGEFYAKVGEELLPVFKSSGRYVDGKVRCEYDHRAQCLKLFSSTMSDIRNALMAALKEVVTPEVKVENVIRYSFRTNCTYAFSPTKGIFPNKTFADDAEWHESDNQSRRAFLSEDSGHSITIAADAVTKTTTTYSGSSEVSYARYYGPDDESRGGHHGITHPAQKLNAWNHMNMQGDTHKEIPYTDEAALFFHNIILGMATLSNRFDEAFSDPEAVQSMIEKMGQSSNLLSFTPEGADND